MKIEQIYTGCLAQGAYYIASSGEAAIIDPLRETGPYLQKAEKDNVKIKYVFETHFHADFVSGHLELAHKTGATIVYGPTARPDFAAHIATDGESFRIGKITLIALHTPGHTMESTTYLLRDEDGNDHAIFTGDTLFLGDVGRPDLAQKASHLSQDDLAGILYDSLRNKIMVLPDQLTVYPGHGAGSACGKNMMKETVDSLGHQKQVNYALQPTLTKEDFIKEVTSGLLPPPSYFSENVKLNKHGSQSLEQVLQRGSKALSPQEFEAAANETGTLLLDTRPPQLFAAAFIPNSINIGIDGSFAPWAGALIPDLKQAILLIADPGREQEVITRLARVGYDYTIGYLEGGIQAWQQAGKETDSISSVSAAAFEKLHTPDITLIDVRKPSEFSAEHIEHALNLPLEFINEQLESFPTHKPVYVHCAGGYRSMITCSILRSRGWRNVIDIAGGYKDMHQTSLPRISLACPSAARLR